MTDILVLLILFFSSGVFIWFGVSICRRFAIQFSPRQLQLFVLLNCTVTYLCFSSPSPNLPNLNATSFQRISLVNTLDVVELQSDSMLGGQQDEALLLLSILAMSLINLTCLLYRQWQFRCRLRRAYVLGPALYESNEMPSAFAIGWWQSKIYVPSYFHQLTTVQQQVVVTHEQTHIHFRDPMWLSLFSVLKSLLWFNPLFRALPVWYNEAIEFRCDKNVVKHLVRHHELSFTDASRLYANTIIENLKFAKQQPKYHFHQAIAAHALPSSMIEERIKVIVRPKSTRSTVLSMVFMSLLCALSFIPSAGARLVSQEISDWVIPVVKPNISSRFGHVHSFRNNNPHRGVDFAAPVGTPVLAAKFGRVRIADNQTYPENFGNVIVIEHDVHVQSVYAHLDSITVKAGSYVLAGQIIGTVGQTGKVTGPHLHFEIHENNRVVNPIALD